MKFCNLLFAIPLAVAAHLAFAADALTVEIKKFAFEPKEITVAPGTKITWVNRDETPHQIKAGDGGFVSPAMDTDDKYERVFAKEGDFSYVCTLHPFMTGIVHVKK
jgi:plastocyanin